MASASIPTTRLAGHFCELNLASSESQSTKGVVVGSRRRCYWDRPFPVCNAIGSLCSSMPREMTCTFLALVVERLSRVPAEMLGYIGLLESENEEPGRYAWITFVKWKVEGNKKELQV